MQIHYLKLHIPWNLMCDYAELLCLRAPLQKVHTMQMSNWSASVLRMLHIPNIMLQEVPNAPTEHYTCQFKKAKIKKMLHTCQHLFVPRATLIT
ncbi:hypothetical protein AHF37_07824 [Paragonimus kellicotti]|nr:hypothetical protein AHF37_07824 [Paragonimus kellicotti]